MNETSLKSWFFFLKKKDKKRRRKRRKRDRLPSKGKKQVSRWTFFVELLLEVILVSLIVHLFYLFERGLILNHKIDFLKIFSYFTCSKVDIVFEQVNHK